MLYLLYGTDFRKTRKNLHALTGALLKRRPDSNIFTLTAETFSLGELEGFIGGQGLFAEKYIVVLDKCMEDKIIKDEIVGKLKDITVSENIFVILEEALDAKTLEKIKKQAEQTKEYEDKPKKKIDGSFFAIADAIGARDKKRAWVEYEKAIQKGAVAEELHGIILWQIKSLILARDSKNQEESGLKPFVYSKSKGFLRNFQGNSLDNLYTELVESYHEAHRGNGSLEEKAEVILLSL